MSDSLSLDVSLRESSQTLASVRQTGIPAVLYGHSFDSQNIVVDAKQFAKIFAIAGYSTMVTLNIGSDQHQAIIREIQFHPLKNYPIHVDFYRVRMDEKIVANVPVTLVGVAPAVKDMGGVLVRNLDEVEVEALPQHMPREITLDISVLTSFDQPIHVKDLSLPQEATILDNADEVVILVQPPRTETELEELNQAATENVEAVEQAKPKAKAEEDAADTTK